MKCPKCNKEVTLVFGDREPPYNYRCEECLDKELGKTLASAIGFILAMFTSAGILAWYLQ